MTASLGRYLFTLCRSACIAQSRTDTPSPYPSYHPAAIYSAPTDMYRSSAKYDSISAMDQDITTVFDATFWLPDKKDRKVAGKLDLSSDWPTAWLTEPLINVPVNFEADAENWGKYKQDAALLAPVTVHGEIKDGGAKKRITLLETTSRNREAPDYPTHPGTEIFQAARLLWGTHEPGEANHKFRDVRLQVRCLDRWARLKKDIDETQRITSPAGRVKLLRIEQVCEAPSYRSENLTTVLELTLQDSLTLDDIWLLVVQPLQIVLTIVADEKCPVTAWQVRSELTQDWVELRSPHVKTSERGTPSGILLWSKEELSLEHVDRWLDRTCLLYPIPAILEKSIGSHHVEFETELLSLAACAEGLHRRIHPGPRIETDVESARTSARTGVLRDKFAEDIADRAYRRLKDFNDWTYGERLFDLAETARPVAPKLTGDTQKWVERITSIRNGFAHLLAGQSETEIGEIKDQSKEFIVLHESLRWLLIIRLMQHIKMADEVIQKGLQRASTYPSFPYRAHLWLPEVYPGTDEKS